ncbi:MAG: tetratricopeptide repeat protein [Chloroflexales bacterium]
MTDLFVGVLSNLLGEIVGDIFGETLKERSDRRTLQRAIEVAVIRAEQQFAQEYEPHDPELVQVLIHHTRFADLPSVRAALRDLLAQPFHDPQGSVAVLRRSFRDVLPERIDRTRVDAAMGAFLGALGREVLYIPQLRELYALSFQKISAESGRATAEHTEAAVRQMAALTDGFREIQASLRQIAAAPDSHLLAAPRPAPPERPRPWHNLPQRSYAEFIGRQDELAQLTRLLQPHPRSRHFVVTIDGIGGVGKSALALELAYGYREHNAALPESERFAAIIWVSAKRTLLTAGGIQQRRQTFNTLDDLFREVATVLEQPTILQASSDERRSLVAHALAAQRTLLVVDNLETVDDEELLSFLRELPDPTKAIITTRHRIDIAYAIRITGLPHADALRLMQVECEAKGVRLAPAEMDDLERRTGGIPLAIQWSIGLMSLGHSVESVLRRLGQGQSDIARFCFAESVAQIRGRDAHRLLLALALFERSVSRAMLGEVAGLAADPVGRDDGMAELLRLSLVNQKGDRFKLLPLTHAFAQDELTRNIELERDLRGRWIEQLVAMATPYNTVHWQQPDRSLLRREGEHLESLALWAEAQERPELLLTISPAVDGYYDAVGRWRDMVDLSRKIIAYARLLGDRTVLRNELNWLAWTIGQQGLYDDAEQAFAEAHSLATEMGDPVWQSEILINRAQLARRRGQITRAQDYCNEALRNARLVGAAQQPFVRADIAIEQGKIARDGDDWPRAEAYFQAAREVFQINLENPGFNLERAWGAYSHFAYVKHRIGSLDEAARMYRESVEALRERGNRAYLATVLVRFADLEEQRGNRQEALGYAQEALVLSQRMGLVPEQDQAAELVQRMRHE